MKITFDPAKRERTLVERGVDFREAEVVFGGLTYTAEDDRWDYGEPRYVTYGILRQQMMVVVWTPRGADRHIISMRKANKREKARHQASLG